MPDIVRRLGLSALSIIATGSVLVLLTTRHPEWLARLPWTVRKTRVITLTDMEKRPTDWLRFYYEPPIDATASGTADWLPQPARYRYNHDGLNSSSDYPVDKPTGIYRITTLGDSFVYGMYVDTDRNFSELLEQALNSRLSCRKYRRFEVINLGVPGYDLQYEAHRFLTKGLKYSPDLLLWYLRDDDFFIVNERFLDRVRSYRQKLTATGSAQRYGVNPADPDAPVALAYREIYGLNAAWNANKRRLYIRPEMEAFPQVPSAYGGRIVLFTLPDTNKEYRGYISDLAAPYPNMSFFGAFGDIPTFHPYDYHPNQEGHRRIAETLYTYLKQTVFGDCTER
jgi:hypothetical protein